MSELHSLAADMRRKYLEAKTDPKLFIAASILESWLQRVEPAADALDAQARRIELLEATVSDLIRERDRLLDERDRLLDERDELRGQLRSAVGV